MEVFSFLCLLLLLLLSLFLYRHRSTSNPKTHGHHKGFQTYPLIGALPDFLRNRNRFLDWTTQVLGDCPTHTSPFYRPGNIHGVITANPTNVEHILKTNFENYPKGERFIVLLQDFFGKGIFNSDGEIWRLQRKTASYEFNTKSLRIFIMENVRVELYTRLIPMLTEAEKAHRILDLQDILERFAFDNICKLAFNFDPGCLGSTGKTGREFMLAFENAATLSAGRFLYAVPFLWRVKKALNIGSEATLMKSISIVHEFADTIIRNRLESRVHNNEEDLLSRFIGKDENSPGFLRDIIISFILAGRDTTSSALSWFFWLLCFNPEVEQSILKELKEIRKRSRKRIGDSYSMEELRDMNYLHAAISETMRLYPPVPVDTKACLNDDVLPDGTFVGKGWFVTYHTYAMGRMPKIWGEDCYEFRPERWLDEKGIIKQESPFRFPVFHAGPRMCLGKDMAYIQMKSIAAAVMERFSVEVPEKEKSGGHLLSLTLRMKGGLPVKVRERILLD
ncbi:hypothetical protein SLE2022_133540 [Rubroshorea leprosula]